VLVRGDAGRIPRGPPGVPQEPPPPPISDEHAAIRERIERRGTEIAAMSRQFVHAVAAHDPGLPEDASLDEAFQALTELAQRSHGCSELVEDYADIANDAAGLFVLMREEKEYLAGQGVDPQPWGW
jgi:hypothetical protein